METTIENKKIHTFEKAGLGKAPFKIIGTWSMPSKALAEKNPTAWNNALREGPKNAGCCQFCFTGIIHHFIIKSADEKIFHVGSSCVNKTFDKKLIGEVKRIKNEIAREKRAEKKAVERKARSEANAVKGLELLNEAGLSKALEIANDENFEINESNKWAFNTLKDVVASATKWGSLSEKQINFLKSLIKKIEAAPAKESQRLEKEANKKPFPVNAGRVKVEGKILGFKEVETQFGWSVKVLLESVDGWKCFGSLPSSLDDAEKGDWIEFTAKLQHSGNDQFFGFFSRPTKAKIKERAGE